jgi:hypothetical protein
MLQKTAAAAGAIVHQPMTATRNDVENGRLLIIAEMLSGRVPPARRLPM